MRSTNGVVVPAAVLSVIFSAFWLDGMNWSVALGAGAGPASSYYASGVVRITFDGGALPLDSKAVESLIRSDEVGAKAVRDILGMSPSGQAFGEGLEFIKVEAVGGDWSEDSEGGAELKPVPTPEPNLPGAGIKGQVSSGGYGGMGGYVNFGWAPGYHSSANRPGQQVLFSTPAAVRSEPKSVERTILVRLEIDLPLNARPLARMLLGKVVEYLREALERAHRDYGAEIRKRLEEAETARDKAKSQLGEAIEAGNANVQMPDLGLEPADKEVYRQLDKIVDLSALNPTMPFAGALELIKNSVEPPLTMVVHWRDLYDNAEVEPTTEINMDGLSGRLGTVLDNLLKAVAGGFGEDIGYIVDNGVLTIATTLSLPSKLETRVYQIPAVLRAVGVQTLAGIIMQTVEPDSWYMLNEETGEGEIMSYVDTKLTILHTREVHVKIAKLLKELGEGLPVGMGLDIPLGTLAGRLDDLQEDKENLTRQVKALSEQRMELARKRDELARQRNREGEELKAKLTRALDTETEGIVADLETLKRRIERGTGDGPELDQVKALIVKARMIGQNVRKKVDLSHSARYSYARGDGEYVLGNRLYSKQVELDNVNNRIGRIENLMTANRVIDPEVSRIRLAARRLELAEGRVFELGVRLANLEAPRVAIVGAD